MRRGAWPLRRPPCAPASRMCSRCTCRRTWSSSIRRGGVDPRVCDALESPPDGARPAAIVYVSCNPATLARDVARLPSYGVAQVQPYDMFPQTAHVETVCLLVPEN